MVFRVYWDSESRIYANRQEAELVAASYAAMGFQVWWKRWRIPQFPVPDPSASVPGSAGRSGTLLVVWSWPAATGSAVWCS